MPPFVLPEPQFGSVLIRDTIQIDDTLIGQLSPPPDWKSGAPIYLVAREITHKSGYQWKKPDGTGLNVPIVVVCNTYSSNGGSIDTSGAAGANGHDGSLGPTGVGTPGQSGTNGTEAAPITVVAQTVVGASLRANGGNAGHGGAGGKGKNGSLGTPRGPEGEIEMGANDGHEGGTGGDAGKAGKGANVTIKYVSAGTIAVSAAGGAAGIGGKGGIGGLRASKHGPGLPRASSGKPGAATPPGANGTIAKSQLSTEAWWMHASAALRPWIREEWADHRERVGEYLFRSHIAATPSTNPKRIMAKEEFATALRLRPDSPRAQRFMGYLDLGLTPIGLPYDFDLKPTVDVFAEFMTDYNDRRDWLFTSLEHFLDKAVQGIDQRSIFKQQQEFYGDIAEAAKLDQKMADIDAVDAQQRLGVAQAQVEALEARLAALAEAKKNQSMSFGEFVTTVGEVVVAVVGIVGAVTTGGTSLMATVAAVGALANDVAALDDKKVSDLVDLSDATSPKLTPNGDKMVGDIKDAVKKTKAFIDAVEAIGDLVNALVADEPDAPEAQVLNQQVSAAFDVAKAQLAVKRSALGKQGAAQKVQAYEHAKANLGQLLASQSAAVAQLTDIARMLLRHFQIYSDVFIRYAFYVNRAYDLYTLPAQSMTRATKFNLGYAHPDIEAAAFNALERSADVAGVTPTVQAARRADAGTKVRGLVAAYLSTVGDDLHPGVHSDYLFYKNNRLQVGEAYWHITSPGVLNALRTHGVATFQTAFSDIDDDVGARTELKIERIEVALVGAKAKNPVDSSVEVWVTHSGRATNRRHVDNKVVALDAPSLSEVMQATLTGIGANVLQSSHTDPRSWGRSPITTWQIRITSQSAKKLDLTGLSELEFAVSYAFYALQGAKSTRPALSRHITVNQTLPVPA
jgi:hypothetical protein